MGKALQVGQPVAVAGRKADLPAHTLGAGGLNGHLADILKGGVDGADGVKGVLSGHGLVVLFVKMVS
jgi:hypothetical protein